MITAFAAYQKQATLNYSGIKITLNDKTVEPFAIDGTTYLPVRAIANALSMDVDWDGSNQTVKLTTEDSKEYIGTYEELGVEGINLIFTLLTLDEATGLLTAEILWPTNGILRQGQVYEYQKVSSFSQYTPT